MLQNLLLQMKLIVGSNFKLLKMWIQIFSISVPRDAAT